jgi:hypothetical protein
MRLPALLSRTLASCAVVGALALAAPAQATTLTNTAWLAPPPESFQITWVGHTPVVNPAATGGFTGDFGGNPIVFWCFDLLHTFSLGGNSYQYNAVQLTGNLANELSALLNVANNDGGFGANNVHSAAFQLAIWNLEYDSDLTLSGGNFSVTGDSNAINLANTWLSHINDQQYQNPSNLVIALNSTDRTQHQNFITFNNVPHECCQNAPEPPILPLVLTAIGAFALVETRRRMRVRGG